MSEFDGKLYRVDERSAANGELAVIAIGYEPVTRWRGTLDEVPHDLAWAAYQMISKPGDVYVRDGIRWMFDDSDNCFKSWSNFCGGWVKDEFSEDDVASAEWSKESAPQADMRQLHEQLIVDCERFLSALKRKAQS